MAAEDFIERTFKGFWFKIALFLLASITLYNLHLHIGFGHSYNNKNVEDVHMIGKRVRVLEGIVAIDTINPPEGIDNYVSCASRWNHWKLAGHFLRDRGYSSGYYLNESDPSFSKEECKIIESYECVPGVLGSAFASSTKYFIVDCNDIHISLFKLRAVIGDK